MSALPGHPVTHGRDDAQHSAQRVNASSPVRPVDNPFRVQRTDALRFVEMDLTVQGVAERLQRHGYRGAIVGRHGTGKSTLLHELGDHLVTHRLSPLPLFMNTEQQGSFPAGWRRTIAKARATDLLMLDGYDHLPRWAKLWVLLRSRAAGGLVVTSHRHTALDTIAITRTSPALLQKLLEELDPAEAKRFDTMKLYREADGNLRDALRVAYDRAGAG